MSRHARIIGGRLDAQSSGNDIGLMRRRGLITFGVDRSRFDGRITKLDEYIRLGWEEVPGIVIDDIQQRLRGKLPECPPELRFFAAYQNPRDWGKKASQWIERQVSA